MIYHYQHNGETHSVQLQAQADGTYIATIKGQQYHIKATPLPGTDALLLEWNGGRVVIHTAAQGNSRYIHLMGQTLTFTLPEAPTTRRRASRARGDLSAQMPGQVVEVLVQPGDSVQSGQTLLILEAMKMEIRISAPAEGKIKRVLAQKGQTVERGQRLIELDT